MQQLSHGTGKRAIATGVDLDGTSWVNELGSVMTITVDRNGLLSGSYVTTAGYNGSVVGWASAGKLGFVVDFGGNLGTTSWVGHAAIVPNGVELAWLCRSPAP